MGRRLDLVSMSETLSQERWGMTGDALGTHLPGLWFWYAKRKGVLGPLVSALQVILLGLWDLNFLVPKRDGGSRPILDLRPFNSKEVQIQVDPAGILAPHGGTLGLSLSIDLKDTFR